MERRAHWYATGVTGAVGLLALLGQAPAAADDPEDDVVRHLDVEIQAQEDGTLHVTETYDWDFGDREGLGFYRSFITREQVPQDHEQAGGHWLYDYSGFELSSTTGAPAEVAGIDESGDELMLSLGAPEDSDQTVTGVQTYELSYEVQGGAEPDRISWWAMGPAAEVPHEEVTTTLTGPADIVSAVCGAGDAESVQAEPTDHEGQQAVCTSEGLEPGEGQRIEVEFPAGTFPENAVSIEEPGPVAAFGQDVAPTTDRAWDWLASPMPAAGGGAGAAALLAIFGAWRIRRGRDWHYEQLPPGQIPEDAQRATLATARLASEPEPVLRTAPPKGLSAYEAAILRRKAMPVFGPDFTAVTLTDLAGRGFLRFVPHPEVGAEEGWAVEVTGEGDPASLQDWEQALLDALPPAGDPVPLESLGDDFAAAADSARRLAVRRFDERGLIARSVSSGWADGVFWALTVAAILLGAMMLAAFASPLPGSLGALLAIPFALIGLLWLVHIVTSTATMPRTALGRAHFEQLRGLEEYHRTAGAPDAEQLDQPGLLLRQLAFAMAVGTVKPWTAALDSSGAGSPDALGLPFPTWYVFATHAPAATSSSAGGGAGSGGFSGGGGGFSGGAAGGGGVAGR